MRRGAQGSLRTPQPRQQAPSAQAPQATTATKPSVAVRTHWRIYPCEHLGCGLYSKESARCRRRPCTHAYNENDAKQSPVAY